MPSQSLIVDLEQGKASSSSNFSNSVAATRRDKSESAWKNDFAAQTVQSSIDQSCKLLQQSPLSVVNRHWHRSREEDMVWFLLNEEHRIVEQAIQTTEKKISRMKAKQEREAAQSAEENHNRAQKLAKNEEMEEMFRTIADENMTGLTAQLVQARENVRTSQQQYQAYQELVKWQGKLNPAEDLELSDRRQKFRVAQKFLTDKQNEYDKRFKEEVLEAAERQVVKMRRQDLEATMSPMETKWVLAVEIGVLHVRNMDDAEDQNDLVRNHLFAAVGHYAQTASLDYISTMYSMHVLLEELKKSQHLGGAFTLASLNVTGQAEYAGQWLFGKAHGLGVEKLQTEINLGNSRYEGQLFEDHRHGLGAIIMPQHSVMYEGMWWRGKRHGFGVQSHIINNSQDSLPVSFLQYEGGNRVSIVRFNVESDLHLLVLSRVREIRVAARALSHQARNNQLFKDMAPRSSFHSVKNEFHRGSPESNRKSNQNLGEDTPVSNFFKQEKRKKQEAKHAEREAYVMSVALQQSELEKVDLQVESAMKELQVSTNKAFGALKADMFSAGMKTGKLYGPTDEEMSVLRSHMPKSPTPVQIKRYLGRQGVPSELAERMVKIHVETQRSRVSKLSEARQQFQQRRLRAIIDLSIGSDWHAYSDGRIIIRKRYTGIRDRRMADEEDSSVVHRDEKDKWVHMPRIPGIDAVLKLMPQNDGCQRVSSTYLPPARTTMLTRIPSTTTAPTQDFGAVVKKVMNGVGFRQAAKRPKETDPVCIMVPMDMPFDLAVQEFDADHNTHIMLLPGTYRIKGTLDIQRSIHIIGEDGARIVGRWRFRGDFESSIKNVHLEYNCNNGTNPGNEKGKDYQRLLHIDNGRLLLQDCAVLCPHGYCLWADGRSVLNVLGCILAGSADGQVPAQGTLVVINSRFPLEFFCVTLLFVVSSIA